MFNLRGLSLFILIIILTSGIAGWFLSKDYYRDANTEVLIRWIKDMSPKKREIILEYIFKK